MFRRLLNWFRSSDAADSQGCTVHPALRPSGKVLSVETLCQRLATGSLEERRVAAYELGSHAGEPSVSALICALRDADRDVQIYAIQSLKKLTVHEAVEPICQMLTGSASAQLVSNICSFCAELRDPRAIAALLPLLKSSNAFARYDAAFALGEIGDPSALPHLRELTNDRAMPRSDDDSMATVHSVGKNAQLAIERILSKAR